MASVYVLLHGALGAADQLAPLAERLGAQHAVHVMELAGHGRTPANGPFTMTRFVDETIAAMDARRVERATLFGYSMGGYVALLLAAAHPDRVARVVTLGTKFRWDTATAERDVRRLDPSTIRAKVPRFADALSARHVGAGGWEGVLARTAALLESLGAAPPLDDAVLASIACPVRVMVGDRDETVTIEETAGAYRALAHGEMAVLPMTAHPLERVDVEMLAHFVSRES